MPAKNIAQNSNYLLVHVPATASAPVDAFGGWPATVQTYSECVESGASVRSHNEPTPALTGPEFVTVGCKFGSPGPLKI
jgi:hypothetical protein